jgi:hypothetical protein
LGGWVGGGGGVSGWAHVFARHVRACAMSIGGLVSPMERRDGSSGGTRVEEEADWALRVDRGGGPACGSARVTRGLAQAGPV